MPLTTNVVTLGGNSLSDMNNALAYAKSTYSDNDLSSAILIPAGEYDWDYGDLNAITNLNNCSILGDGPGTHITIRHNGHANNGTIFNISHCKNLTIADLAIEYTDDVLAAGPTFVDNSTDFLEVRNVTTINGGPFALLGNTGVPTRGKYRNIISKFWRPVDDDTLAWFRISRATNLWLEHPKMTVDKDEPLFQDRGLAFIAIAPQGGLTDIMDTIKIDFAAGGANPAGLYGMVVDVSGGSLVNVWITGVADRATVGGILIKSDHHEEEPDYSIQNVLFDGVHVSPDSGSPVIIDWQSDEHFGNVQFSNMMLIYQADSPAIVINTAMNVGANEFHGPEFTGGAIVNDVPADSGYSAPNEIILAGDRFRMRGMEHQLRVIGNKKPNYILTETADIEYSITDCYFQGQVYRTINRPGVTLTAPRTITNNVGIDEDTQVARSRAEGWMGF